MAFSTNRSIYYPPDSSFLPTDLPLSHTGEGNITDQGNNKRERSTLKLARSCKQCKNRSNDDARDLYMKLGLVSEASGSSYIEQGNTKVLASVYGPHDVTSPSVVSSYLVCRISFSPFAGHVRQDASDAVIERVRQLQQGVADALRPAIIPPTTGDQLQVDVHLLVIDDDGGALTACILASTLALTHAGIDMIDLVLPATILYRRRDEPAQKDEYDENDVEVYVDPCGEEWRDSGCIGELTVSFLPNKDQVSSLYQTGDDLDVNTIIKNIKTACGVCMRYYPAVKEVLTSYLGNKMREMEI